MSGDSSEVSNWLPGEPGKYVTILDLKEQWMKKKHEDEKRRQMKLKEVEKEREDEEKKKKTCERMDELKIGSEEDRIEERFVVGNSRFRSGGRGRGRGRGRICRSEWSDIGGSNSQPDERKSGDGELVRVLEVEKIVYKKKGLVVDDVRVNEDDVAGKYNVKVGGRGRGRYLSGRRFSQDRSNVKGMFSDVTENVDVEEKSKEVVSVDKEKMSRTNCPCHSNTENHNGSGFWVCKYVEPTPRDEIGQNVTGNEAAKGGIAENKNDPIEEVKLPKKHHRPRKVREEMTMEGEKEDVKRVNGDFPRVFNCDDMMQKSWQAREKRETAKGVNDEVIAKEMQNEEVADDKDSRRVINHEGSCQKNDVELQSHGVEPPDEIEDHSKASSLAKRENIRRGKLKAEKDFGSFPINYVKKDSIHVNSSCKKVINHIGSQHVINGSASKLENIILVDCPEKSVAPLLTSEMVENSDFSFRDKRNGIHQRKTDVNKRLQTERIFPSMGIANSGKFNGKMRLMRLENARLMWVKKGEAPLDDAGCKN